MLHSVVNFALDENSVDEHIKTSRIYVIIIISNYSEQGGQPFSITLKERLPEDGTLEKHVAHFDGVGVVNLKKSAPSTLSGRTPGKCCLYGYASASIWSLG